MHFYKTLLAATLMVASAVAQLKFTTFPPSTVEVGKPVTVTWTGAAPGPVTIKLRKGPAGNLKDVSVLTDSGSGGTFTFTLDSNLVDGPDYALEISQGSDINFTAQFAVTGGSGVSSAASSATASGSSTVSSSASATTSAKSSSKTTSSSSSESSSSSSSSSASSTSTSTSASITTSRASTSAPPATSAPAPTNAPNAAPASLSSPFALVLGALAAFVYLN